MDKRVLIGSLQKFSTEDGPGVRTTIFFKGCPLRCQWCHNPEMIEYEQQLMQVPNNCIFCGYCEQVCPQHAIELVRPGDGLGPEREYGRDYGVIINRHRCDGCLKCVDECFPQALKPAARAMTMDEILEVAAEDKGFYDNTGGGVTLSGGEIISHGGFVRELVEKLGEMEINVCIDTCGHGNGELLLELARKDNVTDILFDMKAAIDDMHREYTGVSNAVILQNLRALAADPIACDKIQMRMPLMKGVNDSEEMIQVTGRIYRELGLKRVDLLAYHNFGISKARHLGSDQHEFEPPADERLDEIAAYFKAMGMKVRIFGKIQSAE